MIVLIIIMLFANTNKVLSQSKKEIQHSLDSLQKENTALKKDYNELKSKYKVYNNFVEQVKSKILSPSEMNMSIEDTFIKWSSLQKEWTTKSDSIKKLVKALNDSVKMLNLSFAQLQYENNTYKSILKSSLDSPIIPHSENEFIGSWNLFLDLLHPDGNPFESGIIAENEFFINDSIFSLEISKIDFQKDELAEITYKDGNNIKCFYSVQNLSTSKPYNIYFSKQNVFKLTMHISPMPEGLYVSYEFRKEKENVEYFYGLMKK